MVTEPAGEGTNVPVGVTVAGQTSNVLDFSYDPPSITAISPATGPTAGGVPVTIDGANFGTSGTVTFAGQALPAAAVSSWSQTAIVVTEPAGEGTNVPVGVTVAGQTSNVLDFSYDPPSITAISPATGPTAGGVPVTIDGANFGTSGTVTFAGQALPAAAVSSWSQTAIVVTEPAGGGANVPVDVTVAGQTSNALDFSYDPPSITSVSALQGYVGGGTTVTLSGTDFGVDATSDTVTFGGAQATITAASTTQITVLTPAGTGSVTIDVSVDGQAAGAAQSFAYLNYTSPGSYSADGLGPGTPAAPGFYVPGYGATSELEAQPGYYDPGTGNVAPIPADPGYFVGAVGQAAETPAPAGSYDPGTGNVAPIPAQPGFFVALIGQQAETPAPAGSYDPGTGNVAPIPADPGYFVSAVGQAAETPAPAGSYDPGTGNVAPISAQPGFFVALIGQQAETPAPAGSYDPGTGNVAPIPADPGYFVGAVGQAAETPAPAGSYDPGTGNVAPIPAQPGFFVALIGQQAETPAPAGSYDPGTGNVAPIPADPGYFVAQSAKRPRRQHRRGATIPAPAMWRRSLRSLAFSSR